MTVSFKISTKLKNVALSIRQPWAWTIIHAGKDIENRTWKTNYRGQILIHAPQKIDHDGYYFLTYEMGIKVSDIVFSQRGGIVGVVDLTDCVTHHDSKWFFGEYGFVLSNPKELPFKAMKGKLGLFEVEYDINKLILK